MTYKLLDADATAPKTGDWVSIAPGVYKICSDAPGTVYIDIKYRIDGGAEIRGCCGCCQSNSEIVHVGENEEWRAERRNGTAAVTVWMQSLTRI